MSAPVDARGASLLGSSGWTPSISHPRTPWTRARWPQVWVSRCRTCANGWALPFRRGSRTVPRPVLSRRSGRPAARWRSSDNFSTILKRYGCGCVRRTLTLTAAGLWKRSSMAKRRPCASSWKARFAGCQSEGSALGALEEGRHNLSRRVPPLVGLPRKVGKLPPSASIVPRVCSGATCV